MTSPAAGPEHEDAASPAEVAPERGVVADQPLARRTPRAHAMRTGVKGPPWLGRSFGLVGAALLLASGGVHLDLYLTGYRNIPTIGTLFLVQVAAAVVLSLGAAVVVGFGMRSHAALGVLVAGAAAGLALGTVAAYGVSRATPLFGFHERPTTAGLVAGLLEVGAFAGFGGLAARAFGGRAGQRDTAAPMEESGGRAASGARSRARVETLGLGAVSAVLLTVVLASGISYSAARSSAAPHSSVRSSTAPASPARVVHVLISGYAFHPARVTARPGEAIVVTNEDQVTHTMTAVPGSVPFGGFNTGSVDPGATVTIHAPRAPGTYRFYCSIHLFMKGVVVVSTGT